MKSHYDTSRDNVLFTTPQLLGVEANNRARAGGVEIKGFATGVCALDSEGAVGRASGEVVGAIAGGEVPMGGEGATPPKARDEDNVEAERVAIVS